MITDWFKRKLREAVEDVKTIDETINNIPNDNIPNDNVPNDNVPDAEVTSIKEEIEWIWIDGYKGTDKNMRCRDYQYDIGKKYIHNGKTKECESGFHLCLNLNDVLGFYSFDFNNRYFRVKALVNKNEYSDSKDKLVAKEIEFINELTDDECFKLCKSQKESSSFQHSGGGYLREIKTPEYKYIETIDDYLECKQTKGYETFKKKKHVEKLIQTGIYSDAFAQWFVLIRKFGDDMFEKAIALASENLSHDMRMVLLLT